MKPLLFAVSAAAVAVPVAIVTPAAAQSWEYRQELRECNRELRRADTRSEYRRELRECRRELRRAQRYGSRYWNGYGYGYRGYGYGYDPWYRDRYYPYYGSRYHPYYGSRYYPRNGVYFGMRF